MNNIGIVTYIRNQNYGSSLQAFALQEKIKGLGYNASIIDFLDTKLRHNRKIRIVILINRFAFIFTRPKLISKELWRLYNLRKKKIKTSNNTKNVFQQFEEHYLNISKENYLINETFDAFVCGSDQIWKLAIPGLHYYFYLQFAEDSKKVAYAPSFGGDKLPKYNRKRLKKYLKKFSSISIREESGVEIVSNLLNSEVTQVLDPVLLVGRQFWEEKICDKINGYDNYILCYFLDHNSVAENIVDSLLKEKKRNVIHLGTNMDNMSISPCPLEFVKLIKNAEYVVTDSFHGVCFSILFNKQFYVIPREYKVSRDQETRIISLLRLFDLSRNYIVDASIELMPTNYSLVNEVLEKEIEISEEFLYNALTVAIESSKN